LNLKSLDLNLHFFLVSLNRRYFGNFTAKKSEYLGKNHWPDKNGQGKRLKKRFLVASFYRL